MLTDKNFSPPRDSTAASSELVQTIGEFPLIQRLESIVQVTLLPGTIGIGDDAACVRFGGTDRAGADEREANEGGADGGWLVTTTDAMVEGHHFRLDFTTATDLGWKLLAVSLSDIAAMGAVPKFAVVTLQSPRSSPVSWIEDVYRGLSELALAHGVQIVGGDTVESEQVSLSIALTGSTTRSPVLRSGAQPGDELWVSGTIGLGHLGLLLCQRSINHLPPTIDTAARARYHRPVPRVELGQALAGLASSMIDVSDGLLQDAQHIALQSGVVICIDPKLVPVPTLDVAAALTGFSPLTGGDDYELLFSIPTERSGELARILAELSLNSARKIGVVSEGVPSVVLTAADGSVESVPEFLARSGGAAGYQHFALPTESSSEVKREP